MYELKPVHRGAYIEYDGEKWWSEGTVKATEQRERALRADLARITAERDRLREALEAIADGSAPETSR